MRKLLAVLLIGFMLVGCSSGTSKDKDDKKKDTSLDDIVEKGEIVIGYTDYPPFAVLDGDDVSGFDIDFANEVGKRLGVEVKFKYIDWDAKIIELNSGSIDAIWNGFTITPEREKEVLFTKPYFNNSIVILTPSDKKINSLDALAGKKVGVEIQSSGQAALEEQKETFDALDEMVKYTSISEALLALNTGSIDAIVADENYALYVTGKDAGKYNISDEKFNPERYGIGLRKNSTQLQSKINGIIDEMIEDGAASKISEKWFNADLIIK